MGLGLVWELSDEKVESVSGDHGKVFDTWNISAKMWAHRAWRKASVLHDAFQISYASSWIVVGSINI